jgi:hypothetical protein
MFEPGDCVVCVDTNGAWRLRSMGIYCIKSCVFSSITLTHFVTLINDEGFIEYSSARFIPATSLLKELA